jgi:membrane protease YdiL (CAAX protease family)
MDRELYGVAINLVVALYVAVSAYNRRLRWWSLAWTVPALFFGVLLIPFFRAFRPLKKDEVRQGGKVFLVLRDYARIIILLMVGAVLTVCTITQNPNLISQNSASLTEAEQTGAFLGSWLGMICYIPIGFVVWLTPQMFKSDAVVEGPTGPLASSEET